MWFQVLFHSPLGVLFTFPSRYWFTIGYRVVFSLRRWASRIRTGFHVTRTTWEYIKKGCRISLTGLSPSMACHIQTSSTIRQLCNLPAASYHHQNASRDPKSTTDMTFNILLVWAVPLSLAATYGIAYCFIFLQVLRCFNSLGWLPWRMHSARDY